MDPRAEMLRAAGGHSGPGAATNETQTNQSGGQQSDLTLLNINRVEIWHAA